MNRPIVRISCFAAVAAAVCCLEAGCGHPTVDVKAAATAPTLTSTPTALPGIPFYTKRGMCKRETVWAEPKYTLEVDVVEGDKPAITRTITFPHSFLNNADLRLLVEQLNALAAVPGTDPVHGCNDDVAAQWRKVANAIADAAHSSCDAAPSQAGCETIVAAEANGNLLRLSNTANVVAEVDYEHPYYMNARTPWIGTSQVDAKLNSDGTLSESSAQVNDQTWATILSTITSLAGSYATYASAGAAAAPAAAAPAAISAHAACADAGWPPAGNKVVYRITPSTEVFLHDHVKENTGITTDTCIPASEGVSDGSVTISKQDDAKAKDDGSAIKVAGTVTLPKADAAKK